MIYVLWTMVCAGALSLAATLGHIARQERQLRARVLSRIAARPFTPRRFYRLEPTVDGYWAQFVDRDRPTYDLDAFVSDRARDLADAAFRGTVLGDGQYIRAAGTYRGRPVYVQLTPVLRLHFSQLAQHRESPRDW